MCSKLTNYNFFVNPFTKTPPDNQTSNTHMGNFLVKQACTTIHFIPLAHTIIPKGTQFLKKKHFETTPSPIIEEAPEQGRPKIQTVENFAEHSVISTVVND
jgi:hypothetical protein